MGNDLLAVDDRIHVVTRRLFPEDVRRHFLGVVKAVTGVLVKLEGHSFVFDTFKNAYYRQPEERTRIFDLGNDGLIVNKLPGDLDIDEVRYRVIDSLLVATDLKDFSLQINEFGVQS